MDQTPPFAVITGASRGIGAEYARALAAQGYDLLLVARDSTRLETLRHELHRVYQREIWTKSLDLSQSQAAETLYNLARSYRAEVSLLINNAGFGLYGHFVEMPHTGNAPTTCPHHCRKHPVISPRHAGSQTGGNDYRVFSCRILSHPVHH